MDYHLISTILCMYRYFYFKVPLSISHHGRTTVKLSIGIKFKCRRYWLSTTRSGLLAYYARQGWWFIGSVLMKNLPDIAIKPGQDSHHSERWIDKEIVKKRVRYQERSREKSVWGFQHGLRRNRV
jgi:hypothetical protein